MGDEGAVLGLGVKLTVQPPGSSAVHLQSPTLVERPVSMVNGSVCVAMPSEAGISLPQNGQARAQGSSRRNVGNLAWVTCPHFCCLWLVAQTTLVGERGDPSRDEDEEKRTTEASEGAIPMVLIQVTQHSYLTA